MSAVDDVALMLALVPWLLERPGASIAETAEAFGASESRIRRDLYRLDYCGLPGLGGGDLFDVTIVGDRITVAMADELRRPLRLTPREALRLVLTLDAVAAALGDRIPALRSALAKVRRALGVPSGAAVDLASDGTAWREPLSTAIDAGRRVRLAYQGRTDDRPRTRTVDPWVLRVVAGVWYLQGHDVDASGPRTFRLDRVSAVEVLDDPLRTPVPDPPPPAPRYVPAADEVTVEVLLGPDAVWFVDTVEPSAVEHRGDGWTRVRFGTDALGWVQRLLLSAGGSVRIERPASLRDDVASRARAALARYGEDPTG